MKVLVVFKEERDWYLGAVKYVWCNSVKDVDSLVTVDYVEAALVGDNGDLVIVRADDIETVFIGDDSLRPVERGLYGNVAVI